MFKVGQKFLKLGLLVTEERVDKHTDTQHSDDLFRESVLCYSRNQQPARCVGHQRGRV